MTNNAKNTDGKKNAGRNANKNDSKNANNTEGTESDEVSKFVESSLNELFAGPKDTDGSEDAEDTVNSAFAEGLSRLVSSVKHGWDEYTEDVRREPGASVSSLPSYAIKIPVNEYPGVKYPTPVARSHWRGRGETAGNPVDKIDGGVKYASVRAGSASGSPLTSAAAQDYHDDSAFSLAHGAGGVLHGAVSVVSAFIDGVRGRDHSPSSSNADGNAGRTWLSRRYGGFGSVTKIVLKTTVSIFAVLGFIAIARAAVDAFRVKR